MAPERLFIILRIIAFAFATRFSEFPFYANLYEVCESVTIAVVSFRGVIGVLCSFGVSESVDELCGARRAIKLVFKRSELYFLHLSVITVRNKHSFVACLF